MGHELNDPLRPTNGSLSLKGVCAPNPVSAWDMQTSWQNSQEELVCLGHTAVHVCLSGWAPTSGEYPSLQQVLPLDAGNTPGRMSPWATLAWLHMNACVGAESVS